MKGQLKVSTPAEYIAKLDEPRKSDVAALDALIRKTAPKLEPFIHIGKACVRFKRLSDLDQAALKMIREGAQAAAKT